MRNENAARWFSVCRASIYIEVQILNIYLCPPGWVGDVSDRNSGPALGLINAENEQDVVDSRFTVHRTNLHLLQLNLTLKSLPERFAAGSNISAPLGNTCGTRWVSRKPGFQIRMLETGFLNRIIHQRGHDARDLDL